MVQRKQELLVPSKEKMRLPCPTARSPSCAQPKRPERSRVLSAARNPDGSRYRIGGAVRGGGNGRGGLGGAGREEEGRSQRGGCAWAAGWGGSEECGRASTGLCRAKPSRAPGDAQRSLRLAARCHGCAARRGPDPRRGSGGPGGAAGRRLAPGVRRAVPGPRRSLPAALRLQRHHGGLPRYGPESRAQEHPPRHRAPVSTAGLLCAGRGGGSPSGGCERESEGTRAEGVRPQRPVHGGEKGSVRAYRPAGHGACAASCGRDVRGVPRVSTCVMCGAGGGQNSAQGLACSKGCLHRCPCL